MAEFIEVVKQRSRMCDSFDECSNCGLYGFDCGDIPEGRYREKYEKIVMGWAKEHPVMTNADKFKEVFGFDIKKGVSKCLGTLCLDEKCTACENYNFWDKEYIEPKETTKKQGNILKDVLN